MEVLRLLRSTRNTLAPISMIPPEVLALVPDFWDREDRGQDLVALTHVCKAWRETFTSCSSLWTDLDCVDADKTRAYLKRSKSSPIHLSLNRDRHSFFDDPDDPFFELAPEVIGRLESLTVKAPPEHFQEITDRLSCPAPLLRRLEIDIDYTSEPQRKLVLGPALFDGDLSSLRKLHLGSVRTELPWRNMVNLTSFKLCCMPPWEIATTQLLDFLESAPRLSEVELYDTGLTYNAQRGRLVSLQYLKKCYVYGWQPSSTFFDHLLIPIGADLTIELDLPHPWVEDHLPKSLNNLRNFPNFNKIDIFFGQISTRLQFSGPNGRVCLELHTFGSNATQIVLKLLALFDTSKIRELELTGSNLHSDNLPYKALSPMKNLRILTIPRCPNLSLFFHTIDPGLGSSKVVICPKLEKLDIVMEKGFDAQSLVSLAVARASRGAKLESVRIVSRAKLVPTVLSKLRERVSYVEYEPPAVEEEDSHSGDDSDEGDSGGEFSW